MMKKILLMFVALIFVEAQGWASDCDLRKGGTPSRKRNRSFQDLEQVTKKLKPNSSAMANKSICEKQKEILSHKLVTDEFRALMNCSEVFQKGQIVKVGKNKTIELIKSDVQHLNSFLRHNDSAYDILEKFLKYYAADKTWNGVSISKKLSEDSSLRFKTIESYVYFFGKFILFKGKEKITDKKQKEILSHKLVTDEFRTLMNRSEKFQQGQIVEVAKDETIKLLKSDATYLNMFSKRSSSTYEVLDKLSRYYNADKIWHTISISEELYEHSSIKSLLSFTTLENYVRFLGKFLCLNDSVGVPDEKKEIFNHELITGEFRALMNRSKKFQQGQIVGVGEDKTIKLRKTDTKYLNRFLIKNNLSAYEVLERFLEYYTPNKMWDTNSISKELSKESSLKYGSIKQYICFFGKFLCFNPKIKYLKPSSNIPNTSHLMNTSVIPFELTPKRKQEILSHKLVTDEFRALMTHSEKFQEEEIVQVGKDKTIELGKTDTKFLNIFLKKKNSAYYILEKFFKHYNADKLWNIKSISEKLYEYTSINTSFLSIRSLESYIYFLDKFLCLNDSVAVLDEQKEIFSHKLITEEFRALMNRSEKFQQGEIVQVARDKEIELGNHDMNFLNRFLKNNPSAYNVLEKFLDCYTSNKIWNTASISEKLYEYSSINSSFLLKTLKDYVSFLGKFLCLNPKIKYVQPLSNIPNTSHLMNTSVDLLDDLTPEKRQVILNHKLVTEEFRTLINRSEKFQKGEIIQVAKDKTIKLSNNNVKFLNIFLKKKNSAYNILEKFLDCYTSNKIWNTASISEKLYEYSSINSSFSLKTLKDYVSFLGKFLCLNPKIKYVQPLSNISNTSHLMNTSVDLLDDLMPEEADLPSNILQNDPVIDKIENFEDSPVSMTPEEADLSSETLQDQSVTVKIENFEDSSVSMTPEEADLSSETLQDQSVTVKIENFEGSPVSMIPEEADLPSNILQNDPVIVKIENFEDSPVSNS